MPSMTMHGKREYLKSQNNKYVSNTNAPYENVTMASFSAFLHRPGRQQNITQVFQACEGWQGTGIIFYRCHIGF